MSYRQKPMKEEATEKKEDSPLQEILEPKKVEAPKPRQKPAPKKLVENPIEPNAARPEKETASGLQQEERSDAGNEKVLDAERSKKDSGGATGMVREATPRYKINPPPRYPRTARRRGAQGTVMLSVYVDTRGRVANLWVFESSGYRVLDNAALEAVKKWSFEPGRKGRITVAMWVNVPVRFELQ
jgi:protein TonB